MDNNVAFETDANLNFIETDIEHVDEFSFKLVKRR